MELSNTLDQNNFHLVKSLLKNSDGLFSCELEPAEKKMRISSSLSASETSPELDPLIPIHNNAFGRDTNDVIWAKNKDFELPLVFRAQDSDRATCKDANFKSDQEDEDYVFFLQNVRKDGKSCDFQFKRKEDGVDVFIKYEEADNGQEMYQSLGNMTNVFHRGGQNYLSRCKDTSMCNKPKAYSNCKKNFPCQNCKLGPSVHSKKEGKMKRAKHGNAVCHNSKTTELKNSGNVPTKIIGKRKATFQCNCRQTVKAEEASLQYNASQIVKAEDAVVVKTEEPFLEQSSSDVPAVEILESSSLISCIQSANFRKNLEATLKEPFNTQQLHDMWSAVNCRKPVVQLRQTRRRTVQVETSQEGSSYLDYHPDLAEKLVSTTSPEEKLSLLRGFFFWLKNASWEDAFKPWASYHKRQSCANINDEDDCIEVDRPDREMIAIVLPVEDSLQLPRVRVKEEMPDI